MQFYLLVPFVFLFFSGHGLTDGRRIAALGVLLVMGIFLRGGLLALGGWDLWSREIYKTLVGNLDLFLGGFFLSPLVMRYSRARRFKTGLPAGMIVLMFLYVAMSFWSGCGMVAGDQRWRYWLFTTGPTVCAVAIGVAILLFEARAEERTPSFTARVGKRTEILGLLTYAIYVWHEPILVAAQSGYQSMPRSMSEAAARSFACALVVIAIAAIMWRFIEVPFERQKRWFGVPSRGGQVI
jgi:peptidoglycan/LPS O-acetylase OafA/YrhL